MSPVGNIQKQRSACRRHRLAVAAVCALTGLLVPRLADAQMVSRVTISPVLQKKVTSGQMFVGNLMPLRKSVIGSAVDGRVVKYLASEGDFVTKGTVLAQLLTGTLEIERDGAVAELELRRQELKELTNGSRPEEIVQAEARMLGLKARMQYTEAKFRRMQMLYERQTASKEELDEAVSAASEAAQNYAEAEAAWKLTVAGPRAEKIAQMAAKVRVQEETVRHIEDRLEKFTIRAYFDGFVTQELTQLGHWVRQGEAIAEMVDLSQVDVRVLVLEDYIEHLTTGTEVRVELGAIPNRTFTGKIARIIPQADERSRTFPVDVRLTNEMLDEDTPLLKAGMFARAYLPVGKEEDALLVPKDAIVLGGPKPILFVLNDGPPPGSPGAPPAADKKPPAPAAAKKGEPTAAAPQGPPPAMVRPVPVELGVSAGEWIQIKGPLKSTDKVVIYGNERLQPMIPLQPVEIVDAPRKSAARSSTPASADRPAPRTTPARPAASASPNSN